MNCGYIPKDDPSYNFIRAERFLDNCVLILSECLKNKEDKKMSKSFDNFDKKDVFSWANAEDAKEYIGKEGYFAESISILERDIEQQNTSRLIGVDTTEVCCFHARNKGNYSLFLPSDKVKKEKQYRPFTTDEFLKLFKVGDVIEIKHPNAGEVITLITSIRKKTNELTLGCLAEPCSFKGCFESGTEIFLNNQWQPFGVEE